MDSDAFCSSFIDNAGARKDNEIGGAFAFTFSQVSQPSGSQMQVEESAFSLPDEEDENMNDEESEAQIKAEEMLKTRAEMLAEREQLTTKFQSLNIDSTAVKYYFKSLRNISGAEKSFLESISLMTEIIINEIEQIEDDPMKQLMCCRGLLMLSLNESIAQASGQEIAEKILRTFKELLAPATTPEKREIERLSQHALAVQYLAVMPYKQLHELLISWQNILSQNVIQGAIRPMLFQDTVKAIDVLHWLNFTFKDLQDQIDPKEFSNDAVNQVLELRILMDSWANRTKVQVRNGVKITHAN